MGQGLNPLELMFRRAEHFYLRWWGSSRTWAIPGRRKRGAKLRTAGSSTDSAVATNEHQWWHHQSKGSEPGKVRTEWRSRPLRKEAPRSCLQLTLVGSPEGSPSQQARWGWLSCWEHTQPTKMAAQRERAFRGGGVGTNRSFPLCISEIR